MFDFFIQLFHRRIFRQFICVFWFIEPIYLSYDQNKAKKNLYLMKNKRGDINTIQIDESIHTNTIELLKKFKKFLVVKDKFFEDIQTTTLPANLKPRRNDMMEIQYLSYFNNARRIYPTEVRDTYKDEEGEQIIVDDKNMLMLVDSGILVRIIYEEFEEKHLDRKSVEQIKEPKDILPSIDLIENEMTIPKNNFLHDCYHYLVKHNQVSLFDFYKIIMKRRDFLQVIYPGIITFENYLDKIVIEEMQTHRENSNVQDVKTLAFYKILGSFNLIVHTLNLAFNKNLCSDSDESENKNNTRVFIQYEDCIEDIIGYILKQISQLNDYNEKIQLQYDKFLIIKRLFSQNALNLLRIALFNYETDTTSKIMGELAKFSIDKNSIPIIERKWFYFNLLNYMNIYLLYEMNLTNGVFDLVIPYLKTVFTEKFHEHGKYVSSQDENFLEKIYNALHNFSAIKKTRGEKIYVCKTQYEKIRLYHRQFLGIDETKKKKFRVF